MNIQELIIRRRELNASLILYKDKEYIFYDTGISPIIKLIDRNENFSGGIVADKIVGKAAALLFVYLGLSEVFGEVMSKGAVEVFTKNKISYSCSILTDNIINRQGTDICPMEKATENISSPKEAYTIISNKIREP